MTIYKSKLPELVFRYVPTDYHKVKIRISDDAYKVFKQIWDNDTKEYKESLYVLYLNGASNTIGYSIHSIGGSNSTIVDTANLLREALIATASAIIIAHNHPSGDITPSEADDRLTKMINEGCKAIGIRLLDHLIIGDNKYFSYTGEDKL